MMNHPQTGDVIQGTGGVRKVRWNDAGRGKGKRSGIRVIYAYVEEQAFMLLIYAYNKNTNDLTPQQKQAFRIVAEQFRKKIAL